MKSFEEGMIHIIQNISFKGTQSQFQEGLEEDIASVKNDSRLFVKADKSTNFYKLDVPEYRRLLEANVTKTYRKALSSSRKLTRKPGPLQKNLT